MSILEDQNSILLCRFQYFLRTVFVEITFTLLKWVFVTSEETNESQTIEIFGYNQEVVINEFFVLFCEIVVPAS